MKIHYLVILFLTIFLQNCTSPTTDQNLAKAKPIKPNIIYILADDLGYGDLSCYGQKNFSTPNIDRLAAEGMKFTNHYSGSTVCAPSRSALMTGLHTGHTPVRGNKEHKPEGQWPMPDATYTMAEMFKKAGYVTGAFGKWGLGYPGSEGAPEHQGFDRFYGYNCQRIAHHYYPYHLWDNNVKVMLEGNKEKETGNYAPIAIHDEAMQFLEENKDTSFFLFYPSPIPHAELFAPEKYMEKYRGKFLPEKKYDGVDEGEKYRIGPYGSQPESHAAFVAMIDLLDEQVGEIVQKVKELGLEENTLIVFTTDNGPHMEGGADPDYFDSNGPLKGYKRDLYEGGIRVPMIAKWKGQIGGGTTSDHPSAFWDMLPTFGELVNGTVPNGIDGISFVNTLLEKGEQKLHEYLYWEFHERGGRLALRQNNWKIVQYNVNKTPQGAFELYDLSKDVGEENNVAEQFPEKLHELKELMLNARTDSEVFQFASKGFDAEKR